MMATFGRGGTHFIIPRAASSISMCALAGCCQFRSVCSVSSAMRRLSRRRRGGWEFDQDRRIEAIGFGADAPGRHALNLAREWPGREVVVPPLGTIAADRARGHAPVGADGVLRWLEEQDGALRATGHLAYGLWE